MPLLCISLLALLLLPLSRSCDSKRPHQEVRDDYSIIIQTDITNANRSIATLLHNSSCPALKQKQHLCMSDNVQVVVSTLHLLTCKMKNLNISQTNGLTTSVLNSIRCPCLEKPTKEPNVRSKRRTATRQRRNKQKIKKKETKKLCRAEAILSAMTNCYQMLNTILIDT
uniref:Interleukin-7 n=1 Tax=Cyclopterus lumpus TaxID=8103 RepID=A0A8C2XDH4_CYCLU